MKKNIKLIFILLVGLIYGVLIGKYEFFPHSILKAIQDSYETSKNNTDAPKFTSINPQSLISVTPSSIDSIKLALKKTVFGTSELPKSLPATITNTQDEDYTGIDNLKDLKKFEIINTYDIKSVGYIFLPEKSNNRLIFYHQGHSGDFIYGKDTIKYFLKEGFTVYAFSMPLLGKNNQPTVTLDKLGEVYLDKHERLKFLDHPLQYFVTPVIAMLNYAEGKAFKDITMIGISGGGWTTTLVAALDPRINFSYPVAGSYPMFVRFRKPDKNWGDFEETYEALYSKINYLDLYVLGSVGTNRRQLQILNKFDPCCYNGEDYKEYYSYVAQQVQQFNGGSFEVFLDTTHDEHIISEIALKEILNSLNAVK